MDPVAVASRPRTGAFASSSRMCHDAAFFRLNMFVALHARLCRGSRTSRSGACFSRGPRGFVFGIYCGCDYITHSHRTTRLSVCVRPRVYGLCVGLFAVLRSVVYAVSNAVGQSVTLPGIFFCFHFLSLYYVQLKQAHKTQSVKGPRRRPRRRAGPPSA